MQILSTERLLRLPTLEATVGLSRAEIYRRVKMGTMPSPVKLGPKSVAWRWSEIEAWMHSLAKGAQ